MITDHIVLGLKSTKLREKLVNEGNDLTLEKMYRHIQAI